MSRRDNLDPRTDALHRAADYSPFLREALLAQPHIGETFANAGAAAAAEAALAIDRNNRQAATVLRNLVQPATKG